MNVDRIDVRLAPRPPYEAQDLGIQLLRRNARATFAAVAAVMVPIWATVLAFDAPTPMISLFVIWWLKPLMDRVALHVLSRSVFGDTPRLTATLAALPQLIDRPLIAALTWRRLQLRRSLWLPTACLEGLRGRPLRDRQRVLENGGVQGAATLSTVIFLHIEFGLTFSVYVLASMFLPEDFVPPLFELFTEEGASTSPAYVWVSTLLWLPVLLLVESLYVASGFGLYLCRRTQLEGWDIELAFGRLAGRVRDAAKRGLAVALIGAIALFALNAEAAAGSGLIHGTPTPQDPQEVAQEVLEHPDFDTETTSEIWVPTFEGGGGGGGFGAFLAPILSGIAIAALVGIVVALVVYLARRVEAPRARAVERVAAPTEAFGLDLRPESLPDDVSGAAAELVRRGDFVAALSLLYRGALARLVEDDHLAIGPGDTEHDCIARVRAAADAASAPRAGYFAGLTESWLRAAWGASPPTSEAALDLCSGWRSHFRRVG